MEALSVHLKTIFFSALVCVSMYQENLVVFYNRVPKSGSTTLMGLVYGLAKRNRFHCLHLNTTKNEHYMSPADQVTTRSYPNGIPTYRKLHTRKKPLYSTNRSCVGACSRNEHQLF